MISSSFNTGKNTFQVTLDNGTEVSGTFKVITVRSNSLCALNFQANCDKHYPPAESNLEQSINFMAAQHEILKKLSEFAFSRIKIDVFPNMEEQSDDEQ